MFTGLSTSQFLGGPTLPGAIHTSGIYPSSRLSESYVGQCWTPDQGGVYRVAASGKAQVRAAKWQSSDSSWIAPDTYPTRSIRTRFGSARVPTGTTVGMVSSPAFTNKVTCRKTNPTDTTNITHADGRMSVVTDTTELAAVGLSSVCGTVYKIDNLSGVLGSLAYIGGLTGNTNKHSARIVARASVGSGYLATIPGTTTAIINNTSYARLTLTDFTPPTNTTSIYVRADAGSIVYFILPELVESSYLPADPIVPLTAAADTAAAFTRAAVYMEEDTAGVFPTVTEVAREYVKNNCFATLGDGGADVFAGWGESVTGSSTITQELVDLPEGFTSACKLTTDSSNSMSSVFQNPAYPVVSGQIITITFYHKETGSSTLSIVLTITNGVTPLYLTSGGWSAIPGELGISTTPTWKKETINLPAIPEGYTSINYAQAKRNGVASQSRYITGISIGDTGIQNPYSSAASLMSDGSVVPVVSGASWAQNFAVFGTCVPDATIPSGLHILTSFLTADNYFSAAFFSPTTINSAKRIAATSYIISANYTHATNAPFDYLTLQTIHGMAIRIRPHATMTWSAWATNVTVNGKKPAPLATKYQIGAVLGGGGVAGTHPKVSIYELGNQATLAAYQDRAMLLAGRIV